MARPASIALAGYFPTSSHLLPRIAAILDASSENDEVVTYLDPCAGAGEAIKGIANVYRTSIYACEMEATRHKQARDLLGWGSNILHGDAFRVSFQADGKDGISVLFLNPPYDTDPVHGRLEQRFLDRFTSALKDDGLLLFLVPYYALKASAELLAKEYVDLKCFKFPEGDFEIFKQVVLVARKSTSLFEPDPAIVAQVMAWNQDVSSCPDLPQVGDAPHYKVSASKTYSGGLREWLIRPVDMKALAGKIKPWYQTMRGGALVPIPGIIPDLPVQDLLLRTYPVATPPRPAHIAAGIASGLFNGARIEPTDSSTSLPPLLVKGVFDREYKTIEEKRNKAGEVKSVVQVQQPKLVTTVLDLNSHQYHVLRSGSDESRKPEVSSMGVADLLKYYGQSLMDVMERQCPIMYDPRKDADSVVLAPSQRKLFTAQAHATRAIVKLLGGTQASKASRKGKSALLLGEIGSGKTSCALVAAKTIKATRPLVMCPPHLLQSWVNEAAVVVPEAEVRILQSITDVESVAADKSDRTIISILSRETGKLGHGWDGVGDTCPKCGSETPKVDLAKKRARCTEKTLVPGNLLAQQCMTYARKISKYNPNAAVVAQLLRGRHERLRVTHYAKLHALGEGENFQGFQKGALDYIIDAALSDAEHPEDAQQALVLALVLAGTDDQIEAVSRKFLGADNYSHSDFGRNLLLLLEPGSERQSALIDEFSGKNLTYWNPWKPFKDSIATAKESGVFKIAKLEVSWVDGTLTVEKHERDSIALATRLVHPMVKLAKFRFTAECGEFLYQAIPEPRRVALASHIAKRYPKTFDILIADECFVAGTKVSGVDIETIKVGDIVDSYSEVTYNVCKRRVVKLWVKTPTSLVRVTLNGGKTLICTPNHPFYTENGWVPAGSLYNTFVHGLEYGSDLGWKLCSVLETHSMGDLGNSTQSTTCEGEGLRLLQPGMYFGGAPTENQRSQSKKPKAEDNPHLLVCLLQQGEQGYSPSHNPCKDKGLRVLQSSLFSTRAEEKSFSFEQTCIPVRRAETANLEEDDREEPYETTRDSRQDVSLFERSNFSVARGERPINEASNQTCNSFRLGDGSGYLDRSCVQSIPVLTSSLQGGHRTSSFEASGGGGRGYSQNSKMEILGQEKGRSTSRIRVDSVEILEPGSDGKFGGLCPDGFVYNLEVEGTHTYFAEGVLAHNCHEYSSDASAQGISAHRLVSLGIPTIMQTGTVMNGYAESLFMNMWSLSRNFRAEFNREDKQRFIDRYGYRKRMLEERDTQTGEVVEFGSMSDRVTRSERVVGNAPGILPLFLLRHLLTVSVTLHKTDLAIDLPPCKQELCHVQPSADQSKNYTRLQQDLIAAIKKDRFDEEKAGKLFGQLAELPSYLDRATSDTGNTDGGVFEIRYPESVGGGLVSAATPLPKSELLPKEQWLIDKITSELAEGRNVMIFSWHVNLLARYSRIISERLGETVPILYADKVATGKRQSWIEKEVVKKKRRILVTNPVCIQTGLNNLVHFATEIWMENPGVNPVIFRQAIGRVDRIGQKLETRIFSPVYADTLQVQMYDLLLKKVAVSVSTDGLDPASALAAAGVGEDDYLAGLSIGKQLWAMLTDGEYGSLAA